MMLDDILSGTTTMPMETAIASVAAFAGTSLAAIALMRHQRRLKPLQYSYSSETQLSKDDVLRLRQKYFSKSLSISYANTGPLMIIGGKGSRLFDETGTSYLDTRNNVAHIGHQHPRLIAAVQAQVALLNTNTRYLSPIMVTLAERLASLLPDPLEVVFFCNSGSEANDLALRLARAYSGGSTNTIVVERSYHGHTLATLECSPYKFEHNPEYKLVESPAANHKLPSPSPHIWQVPCPDIYRGKHRNFETAGKEYAAYVEEACRAYQESGQKVRAFIVEGGMSVAGCILPPPGYLYACAQAVRKAGGLYIADEIQTGLGRLGSCFWAFQHKHSPNEPDVIPDIVTVGKPFGNGMCLAAVITSREVVSAFEDYGVEYFNTFAGNPVCAAAGLAVLDTIEEERLVENALEVGTFMKTKFQELQQRLDIIGDVRGSGLFLAIELVRNQSREPAVEETSFICSILKSKYKILTSIDGKHDNVIMVKPPMVFSFNDAIYFVTSFENAVTKHLTETDLTSISKTPT